MVSAPDRSGALTPESLVRLLSQGQRRSLGLAEFRVRLLAPGGAATQPDRPESHER